MILLKKNFTILFLIFVLILLVAYILNVVNLIQRWESGIGDYSIKYKIKDDPKIKDSFQSLSEKLMDIFERKKKNYDNLERIIISQEGHYPNYMARLELVLSNGESIEIIEELNTEGEAIEIVRKSLSRPDGKGLLFIQVFQNKVVYQTMTPYSVIYKPNGARPKSLLSEENEELSFVDKISSKLYECMG